MEGDLSRMYPGDRHRFLLLRLVAFPDSEQYLVLKDIIALAGNAVGEIPVGHQTLLIGLQEVNFAALIVVFPHTIVALRFPGRPVLQLRRQQHNSRHKFCAKDAPEQYFCEPYEKLFDKTNLPKLRTLYIVFAMECQACFSENPYFRV